MRPHFSILGVPVFVRASFFVVTVMLGATRGTTPQSLAAWVAIVFASVLAHELGHAMCGRAFGLEPVIQLVGMGGLTSWPRGRDLGPWKSLAISLAGPAVGIVLGGVALVAVAVRPALSSEIATSVIWVNLGWGVLNLVPMLPLDGGNALRSLLSLVGIEEAEISARVVSIAVAAVLGVLALTMHWFWSLVLVAMFTVQNFQAIRGRFAVRADDRAMASLSAEYPRWLAAGDGESMLRAGLQARASARTPGLAAFATEVVAMGQALSGDARSALATLQTMPDGYAPGTSVLLFVLERAGEIEAARQVALDALSRGDDAAARALLERHPPSSAAD